MWLLERPSHTEFDANKQHEIEMMTLCSSGLTTREKSEVNGYVQFWRTWWDPLCESGVETLKQLLQDLHQDDFWAFWNTAETVLKSLHTLQEQRKMFSLPGLWEKNDVIFVLQPWFGSSWSFSLTHHLGRSLFSYRLQQICGRKVVIYRFSQIAQCYVCYEDLPGVLRLSFSWGMKCSAQNLLCSCSFQLKKKNFSVLVAYVETLRLKGQRRNFSV